MVVATVAIAQPRAEPSLEYVVIVHSSNPTGSVTRSFLADAFLKRVTRWPHGETIRPVDLASDSPVRQRFTERVLSRPLAAVRSYWQQIIFTGRGVPPVEFGNDLAVISYVRSHRGAVGYVSASANIDGLSVLEVR